MSGSKMTIDDLARMMQNCFRSMQDQMDKGFDEVKQEISELRTQNEKDHLDLKLRQDNAAYRFELQDLDKRVTQLEKKAKFA